MVPIVRRLVVILEVFWPSMKPKHPLLVELGRKIRRIRESRSLSQEQLASIIDIDRTYIGGIERGERNVAAVNLARIAIALDTEVGEFFPQKDTSRRLLESTGHA